MIPPDFFCISLVDMYLVFGKEHNVSTTASYQDNGRYEGNIKVADQCSGSYHGGGQYQELQKSVSDFLAIQS